MKYFPAEIEAKVVISNGEQVGVATIGLGHGCMPSNIEVCERIRKFAEDELSTMAPGYRLLTASEYFDHMVEEKTGSAVKFATPAEWREFADPGKSIQAELLEALEKLVLFTNPKPSNSVALNYAHQVIAKARGES